MTQNLRRFLSTTPPFEGLPEKEMDKLLPMAHVVHHKKGEHVFTEGEEASSVWVLQSGRLDIYKYSVDGKPRAIEQIMPKELYGTLCRLGGAGKTYPCTAVVVEEATSVRIPDALFREMFDTNPSIVTGVCSLCSQRLNQMQNLNCSSQDPVEVRIARILLTLEKKHGATLPVTKREIGDFAGATVETTIRTMSRFQKSQWIDSSRGKIIIKDKARLQALVN